MTKRDVIDALDLAIDEMTKVLDSEKTRAKAAIDDSRMGELQGISHSITMVQAAIEKTKAVRSEWENSDIRREARSLKRAKSRGKVRRRRPTEPLQPGLRTQQGAYRIPILKALVELGGSGRVADVLELVSSELKTQLLPDDLTPIPSNPRTLRWVNSAQWERQAMVDDGLLLRSSRRGVWSISAAGQEELAKRENRER